MPDWPTGCNRCGQAGDGTRRPPFSRGTQRNQNGAGGPELESNRGGATRGRAPRFLSPSSGVTSSDFARVRPREERSGEPLETIAFHRRLPRDRSRDHRLRRRRDGERGLPARRAPLDGGRRETGHARGLAAPGHRHARRRVAGRAHDRRHRSRGHYPRRVPSGRPGLTPPRRFRVQDARNPPGSRHGFHRGDVDRGADPRGGDGRGPAAPAGRGAAARVLGRRPRTLRRRRRHVSSRAVLPLRTQRRPPRFHVPLRARLPAVPAGRPRRAGGLVGEPGRAGGVLAAARLRGAARVGVVVAGTRASRRAVSRRSVALRLLPGGAHAARAGDGARGNGARSPSSLIRPDRTSRRQSTGTPSCRASTARSRCTPGTARWTGTRTSVPRRTPSTDRPRSTRSAGGSASRSSGSATPTSARRGTRTPRRCATLRTAGA